MPKFFATMLLVVSASAAQAQQLAVVTGQVTDPSAAVVPGAVVVATEGGRQVAATASGPDGRFALRLPAGAYDLTVTLSGFADERFPLAVSGDVERDVVLRIAAIGDTLIVTASRSPERRTMTTESVAVFTAEDIAAAGAAQLGDVVRQVPGLVIEANGREGAVASLFARGGESDYNHVLIDGVRVNANGGQFDFSRITAAEIERVEVVRGAQSALYGSDAIGSVIQVFTRRAAPADPPYVTGSAEAGSFNTWRGSAHLLGGAWQRVDYQAGVSFRGTEGAFEDVLPEHDRFQQRTFTGGVGASLGTATLRASIRVSDARGKGVGPIAYGPGDVGTLADTEEVSWHGAWTQRLTERVTHTATAGYFRSRRTSGDRLSDPSFNVFAVLAGQPGAIFPDSPRLVRLVDAPTFAALQAGVEPLAPGQFLASTPFGVFDFPFTTTAELRRPAFRYQMNVTWAAAQLLAGYDFEREANPLAAGFRTTNHAYFAQQEVRVRDRWVFSAGARVDDNSRYGTEVSPKASAGVFIRPFTDGRVSSVKLFANVGRGIKNPLFGELFGSAFTDGNPALHPERARTVDGGAELTFAAQRWLARVAYFDNAFTDQVAFRSSGPGLDGRPDFVNIDGSEARGWEMDLSLQRAVSGFSGGGSYAWLDTKVVAFVSTSEQFQPGQPLLRRPKHSGTLYGSYTAGRAVVHANARFVGDRHDAAFLGLAAAATPGSSVAAGRPVDITVNPAYVVLGVGADYRVRRELTVFLRIDNATAEAYESALGYPGLPRAAMVGARFVLGRR